MQITGAMTMTLSCSTIRKTNSPGAAFRDATHVVQANTIISHLLSEDRMDELSCVVVDEVC